jgi:lysine biosynthesis protein LysW
MAQHKDSNIALCPECDNPIQLSGKLHIGQRLSCRRCGSTLSIIDQKPLELDLLIRKRPGNDPVKTHNKQINNKDAAPSSPVQFATRQDGPVTTPVSQALMTNCPECDARLRFHMPPKMGQLLACPKCKEALEVVSLRPIELSWVEDDPWDQKTTRI